MAHDRVDSAADLLPVDLRHVELGAVRAQEDRVRQRRVVVDVRKARQADWERGADRPAQVVHVRLRLRVPALVLLLGVDHEAVGAGGERLGAHGSLGRGIGAVHVLPGAHVQAARLERAHELRVELRPVGRAVAALHEHR